MKGRFAPSPTGRMHLGNVFSALLSYASIKSKGGSWILRIEDLDPGRSRPEYSRQIEEDLLWLGLEWDEGGMDNSDFCQSRRSGIYDHYFKLLQEQSMVYPCWCSRADLLAASAPHQSDGRVVYPGSCRPGFANEAELEIRRQQALSNGRKPAWRIICPDKNVTVKDIHYGPVSMNLASDCGDFIIKRADGTAAYQLAVVVDDALMGVTEVVRGNDLLPSSPQQAWLHESLGFTAPDFAHLPLLCAADGRRLCKRDRDMDMGELRRRYSPQQLLGLLANLAGLQPTADAIKLKDLVRSFDWNKVPLENIIL
ncbi:MAG: tRNA glutamyl-Q(34) synthetase GluQRS [Bacteroidales bacterium]|nr:tRNA glutamyl-Q(34) synthetase GluQRS [Bacteroidales bacterium]